MKRGNKDDARGGLLLLAVVAGLALLALGPDIKPTRLDAVGDWSGRLEVLLEWTPFDGQLKACGV